MEKTYTVDLIYKDNITIQIENAISYAVFQEDYKVDNLFTKEKVYIARMSEIPLSKIVMVKNFSKNTFEPVNLIIFKLTNGEQVVSTKDLLSLRILEN